MRNLFELCPNGSIDSPIIMTMQVRPNRRVFIQVAIASDIGQHSPFTFGDDDRFAPEPIAHLSKGMPDMPMIELSRSFHGSRGQRHGASVHSLKHAYQRLDVR